VLKAVALNGVRLFAAGGCVTSRLRVFGLGAGTARLCRFGSCWIYTATVRALAAFTDCPEEDAGCATNAGLYSDSVYRTIDGTGTTLNAGVTVDNNHFSILYFEYFVGTDDDAHTAAVTDLGIKLQGYDIFQIPKHLRSS